MTMKHWMAMMLALMLGVADVRAQPAPGVEETSYANALAIKEPLRRAQALEVFIAWYPGSPLRIAAFEQAMAAWQSANNPEKADAGARLLQIDPTTCAPSPTAPMSDARAPAERVGSAPPWPPPSAGWRCCRNRRGPPGSARVISCARRCR